MKENTINKQMTWVFDRQNFGNSQKIHIIYSDILLSKSVFVDSPKNIRKRSMLNIVAISRVTLENV